MSNPRGDMAGATDKHLPSGVDMVRGDRALEPGDIDRLGFREVARRLAATLIDHGLGGNLVVGLDGRWGSGKSSLLNLVRVELEAVRQRKPHSVVDFRPWLVGDRNALLNSLFGEISAAIDHIQYDKGDATRETVAKVQRTAAALRDFTGALARAGSMIEFAGDVASVKGVTWLGKFIRTAGEAAQGSKPQSLEVLKEKLVRALKALDRRIIITIDDLDRLEPAEVIEVLRLVRSVADFPNVIYLLCYDSDILAGSIRRAAQVEDGHAYLEKIVQLSIMVPRPEAFQLRHWFGEELQSFATPIDEIGQDRLRTTIDMEGGRQLETPRAVNRALDSLRLLWPVLREQNADLADLVWLQLIKDRNPRLYRWIEDYCAIAAEVSLGVVRIDDEQRSSMLRDLIATDETGFASIHYRHFFADFLPGVEETYGKDEPGFKLFGRVPIQARDRAIAGRRLASPDHYRLYFALSDPTHALQSEDFDRFWAASDDAPKAVGDVIVALHREDTSRVLSKGDILLERLRVSDPDAFTPPRAANMLLGFAECLDEAWRVRPFDRGWVTSLWDRAEALLPVLLGRLTADDRRLTVEHMFQDGAALGWLTRLYRSQTFSHGHFGNESKPEEDWTLSENEYQLASRIMVQRYAALSIDEILTEIEPNQIFFAWSQGGAADEVRAFVASIVENDAGLVRILGALQSRISTSHGQFQVLKRANLNVFLEYDDARARISKIAGAQGEDSLRSQALLLKESFETGDHY